MKNPLQKELPYPRICLYCKEKRVEKVVIEHTVETTNQTIVIPDLKVNRCAACNEVSFDLETDAQINFAIQSQRKEK